jgi:hypothetical protein
MRLFGPDGSDIMAIEAIALEKGNIVIRGKIMGAMPLSAIIRPDQLRHGIKLISLRVVFRGLWMLIRGK